MTDRDPVAIPDFCLVVLIGPTGSGKSSFAARHFLATEIVSSDRCRALVSDDEADQSATQDAFDLVEHTAGLRLKRRKLTVIDATSVRKEDRSKLIRLARAHHALPVAMVFDIDPQICNARNKERPDRSFGPKVAWNHSTLLRKGLRGLQKEGFRQVHIMRSPQNVEAMTVAREPLWTDRRVDFGPFDIIGDVHGCFDELTGLLDTLGYRIDASSSGPETLIHARHPEGRIALFVGDLTDRGPKNLDCLRLVMGMCEEGSGRCVMGNHDYKLLRWLRGRKVSVKHGLDLTVSELETVSPAFRDRIAGFLDGLRSHQWLAGGDLVVAHAGLKEEMHGRGSGAVRQFAMFGDTTGEVDEFGLPVRLEWARGYRGKAEVVYGHTPTLETEWLNGTLCIDTGCVFGGKLTALRWPEREIVSVSSQRQYAVPAKPLQQPDTSSQQEHDRLLFFDEYACKQRIVTRFGGVAVVPEENSLAALEIMSRFGIDPRWLIHLPPTMGACPTAPDGPYLEHPQQAFDYYLQRGITDLVVEEKHMGSRALAVVTRDAYAARKRFGVDDGKSGVVHTRTGRAFFTDPQLESELVDRLRRAVTGSGIWDELATDWLLLDCELMPWSAKAGELVNRQYLPTAVSARFSAEALVDALNSAPPHEGLENLRRQASHQLDNAAAMQKAIDAYCWDAPSLDDYRLAPFHILAAEGAVFHDRPHRWHMETIAKLADTDPLLQVTGWRAIDAGNEMERREAADWWLEHTSSGGEGFVVKPAAFAIRKEKKFEQPAIKVRGLNYLRIIYGPDYTLPHNLDRLRKRGLERKFRLAEREFQLGLEALHRFVDGRPLRDVHQCVLAVLALESEPVDPRL